MKKNLNQLKWDINYKSINITINDKKNMVKLFSDNYIQFISRIKGTSINSKESLIQILNRKPRSFRKRLNKLVTIFKNFDKQLTRNLKKINLTHKRNLNKNPNTTSSSIKKRMQTTTTTTTITKPKTTSEHLNKLLTYMKRDNNYNKKVNANLMLNKKSSNISSSIISNSVVDISKINNSKLINPKLNILTKKIDLLTTSLNNNELVLPLNLLNPLLKINNTAKYKLESLSLFRNFKKSNLYKNYISSQSPIEKLNLQPELYNKLKITNFWDFLINKNIDEEISPLTLPYQESHYKGNLEGNFPLTNNPKATFPNPNMRQLGGVRGEKANWVETYFKIHGINKSQTTLDLKIDKFNNLIKNFHDNNITEKNITLTKYLKLLTPEKYVNAFHQNIKFNFNKNYKYNNIKIQSIFTLLESAFRAMSCFISKPVFMETPDNLIINLFYFFIPGKVKKVTKFQRSNIATSYKGIAILNNTKFNVNKKKKKKKKKN